MMLSLLYFLLILFNYLLFCTLSKSTLHSVPTHQSNDGKTTLLVSKKSLPVIKEAQRNCLNRNLTIGKTTLKNDHLQVIITCSILEDSSFLECILPSFNLTTLIPRMMVEIKDAQTFPICKSTILELRPMYHFYPADSTQFLTLDPRDKLQTFLPLFIFNEDWCYGILKTKDKKSLHDVSMKGFVPHLALNGLNIGALIAFTSENFPLSDVKCPQKNLRISLKKPCFSFGTAADREHMVSSGRLYWNIPGRITLSRWMQVQCPKTGSSAWVSSWYFYGYFSLQQAGQLERIFTGPFFRVKTGNSAIPVEKAPCPVPFREIKSKFEGFALYYDGGCNLVRCWDKDQRCQVDYDCQYPSLSIQRLPHFPKLLELRKLESRLKRRNTRITFVKRLGGGHFGQVDLVRIDDDKKSTFSMMAKKTFSIDSDITYKAILKEAKSMLIVAQIKGAKAFYPSLNFLKIFPRDGKVSLFMEYFEGNLLHDLIGKGGTMCLSWIATFLRHLLIALRLLHVNNLVHADLKPPNIIVDSKKVVIIDLGTLKKKNSKLESCTTTYWYAPKWALDCSHFDQRIDLHSVAVIALDIAIGEYLFCGLMPFNDIEGAKKYHVGKKRPLPPVDLEKSDDPTKDSLVKSQDQTTGRHYIPLVLKDFCKKCVDIDTKSEAGIDLTTYIDTLLKHPLILLHSKEDMDLLNC